MSEAINTPNAQKHSQNTPVHSSQLPDEVIRFVKREAYAADTLSDNYESILCHLPFLISVVDHSGKLVYANPAYLSLFGTAIPAKQNIKEAGKEVFYAVKNRWLFIRSYMVDWGHCGKAVLYLIEDITEKKNIELEAQKLVQSDPLLHVPNRIRCEIQLDHILERSKATGESGYVFFIDLDNFKNINDTFGHSYGDMLLKEVVARFSEYEEVKDNIYRFGGDEFVLIYEEATAQSAYRFASRILEQFRAPWKLGSIEHFCTVSIGIAAYPTDGATVPEIVGSADAAMYTAKKSGKNSFVFYSENMTDLLTERNRVLHNLRHSIRKDFENFSLLCLPITDIKTNKITGARLDFSWHDPAIGSVSKDELNSLLNVTGLIIPVGGWLLEHACRMCRRWFEKGLKELRVCVRVTLRQLHDDGFVPLVKSILEQTSFDPGSLILSLAGDLNPREYELCHRKLKELHALGVLLSANTFSVGFAPAIGFLRIPNDILRIDGAVVQQLGRDPFADSYIRAQMHLAVEQKVSVCFEGIETEQQRGLCLRILEEHENAYASGKPVIPGVFVKNAMSPNEESILNF